MEEEAFRWMPLYSDLIYKRVLVTGGAGGIGQAICKVFALQHSSVICSDIKEEGEETEGLVKQLNEVSRILHPPAVPSGFTPHTYMKADITDEEAVKALFDRIYNNKDFGTVHILVNAAGITGDDLVLRKGADHLRNVLEVNLVGPYITGREFIRRKRKEKSEEGRIINIGSIIGQVGNRGQAFYSASKGGLHGLTKSLADEVLLYKMPNFTVNAVAPGFIDTEMTAKIPEELREQYLGLIPMKRAGLPMEVALPILFLASKSASYITGAVIPIDGGWVRYS